MSRISKQPALRPPFLRTLASLPAESQEQALSDILEPWKPLDACLLNERLRQPQLDHCGVPRALPLSSLDDPAYMILPDCRSSVPSLADLSTYRTLFLIPFIYPSRPFISPRILSRSSATAIICPRESRNLRACQVHCSRPSKTPPAPANSMQYLPNPRSSVCSVGP